MADTTADLNLGTAHFTEANEKIRAALADADVVNIHECYAQRYIGAAMDKGKTLNIYGVPGNDMACYMNGGYIEVFGNAQDQIGNTMNDGCVVVHGRCGDAAGYGMRGGQIFVREDCGWRVGIHMKQYQDKCPAIIVGGDAGSFLGEYMAGGIIVLLGRAGDYLATGMHGGIIYMKHELNPEDIPSGLVYEPVDDQDRAVLRNLLGRYNDYFAEDLGAPVEATGEGFYRLKPASSRPYASMYAN